ncbi:hypothetical protein FQ154_15560 [Paeniglutamicibacter gangotriensis]|uniref:DUF6434 domain-containing protein n=1 Tax=Paeniglutamicibacter gangotriensis TaxID=254787 RepID=A0A5B0E7K8_9MICC|nr:SAP domain-containing protein [Paeniglutamicibacter gangotriensis]KAA0974262.1 hypothetical protein FQ154_15560 [Paeniglutamicibacter gangotriensis]
MNAADTPERPGLTPGLDGTEFARWYWTKNELVDFARQQGIRTGGGKAELAARLTAFLDGTPIPAPVVRKRAGKQLAPPLSLHTVVPPGQRCSQVLRLWLTEQLGPGFHFDAPMREFFAAANGTTTLADALAHWSATRGAEPRLIDQQFELNRFTRDWHKQNPGGSREEMLAGWKQYRSLPADLRRGPEAAIDR